MLEIDARRAHFRALHEARYFLLPVALDIRSAKHLQMLGFDGLSSSLVSLTWVLGRDDQYATRDEVLAHLRQLVTATKLAVNGDFGSGFAAETKELVANVWLAIDTDIAGLSITDGVGTEPYDLRQAVARIRACRDAIATSGADVVLDCRSGGFRTGHASVDETIERLAAYAEAGADVVCAPGLADPTAIRTLVKAVAPKPVDVQLMKPGLRAAELEAMGVRRVSVGHSFAVACWTDFWRVARRFMEFGDLSPESFPAV